MSLWLGRRRLAWPALKSGQIEGLIHTAIVSHHLIEFTRDCLRGLGETSFYAPGGAEMIAYQQGSPEPAPKTSTGAGRVGEAIAPLESR